MCGEIGGDAEEERRRVHRRARHQAGRRLHRRLHRAAGQDDGPRRRDRLRLAGHRRGEGRGARGEGRAGRPHADRGRRDRRRDRGSAAERSARPSLSPDAGDGVRPHRSPSPAARRRSTSSTSTACARRPQRAFADDPAGTSPTARRSATCRCASGSPSSTASTVEQVHRHQRLDAGRRVPVRRARRRRATPSSSSADLRPHAARRCASAAPSIARGRRSSPTASTSTRWRQLLGGGAAPEARPHHPQLPEPGRLHAVAREARPAARARAPSTTSRSSRTTRTSSCASRARRCRRCSRSTSADTRRLRVARSPRPSARASASATSSARRTLIAAIAKLATEHLHLAEHGRPGDRQRVLPLRRDRALDRDGQERRCASARDALADGARARAARGALRRRPRAATSCGSSCPRASTSTRCSTRGRASAASRSSRAPTSCSRAARTPCASPTRACTPEQIDEGVTRLAEAVRAATGVAQTA